MTDHINLTIHRARFTVPQAADEIAFHRNHRALKTSSAGRFITQNEHAGAGAVGKAQHFISQRTELRGTHSGKTAGGIIDATRDVHEGGIQQPADLLQRFVFAGVGPIDIVAFMMFEDRRGWCPVTFLRGGPDAVSVRHADAHGCAGGG